MILSIIIPAYNVENYIDQCLESCFRQNLPENEYEVIVINDGSTDGTLKKLLDWKENHVNLKVISQENKGLSRTRNKGLELAEGEYVMFLDSDDWIAEDCLKRLTDKCVLDKLDMLRFCAARMIEGKPYRMYSYREYRKIVPGRELLGTKFFVCVPFAIYRKDFLKENNLSFYPGIYHEDNEFSPKAYYYAERVGSTDEVIYRLRQTPGSIMHTVNPKRITDLLEVSEMLHEFAETEAVPTYRPAIFRQAADCINSCFRELNRMSGKEVGNLYAEIYRRRRQIIGYFRNSDSLKQRIEGVMMMIFPKRMLGIYRLLDIVHIQERRRQKGIA